MSGGKFKNPFHKHHIPPPPPPPPSQDLTQETQPPTPVLGPLPPAIVTAHILPYLSPTTLLPLSLLNKTWLSLARTDNLWHRLCVLHGVRVGPWTDGLQWWEVFKTFWKRRGNWKRGVYVVKVVEVVGIGDSVNCFKYDADVLLIGTRRHRLHLHHFPWTSVPHLSLFGHTHPIMCLATTQQHLLTGDATGSMMLWNIFTGELLAAVKAHEGAVVGVGFVSGMVVSAGVDGQVRTWKIQTRIETETIVREHQKGLRKLSKKLQKRHVEVLEKDVVEFVNANHVVAHVGDCFCVWVGEWVVTGGLDWCVKTWMPTTLVHHRTFRGHTDSVTCVAVHASWVMSGSLDKTIRHWDIQTGACLHTFLGHIKWVKTLDVSEEWLVSGGWDECVLVWNWKEGKLAHRIEVQKGPVVALQFDEEKIVVGCRGEDVQNSLIVVDFGEDKHENKNKATS
ncbi:hypothetical protein SpCBS45565_g00728 [Spizellomyces sp. 'palustris']|nr:hypothetical protein SpCBS45565_g00728 [Spizellomyces sp. 'palustris']